jgi:hypothetical protein
MVTASHAARVLFERFPHLASHDALHALWRAACAAYASVGAPPPAEPPVVVVAATPSWPEIFAGAVVNNDDHVIKMTYTCDCEGRRYGNPVYQAAAARLVAVGKA